MNDNILVQILYLHVLFMSTYITRFVVSFIGHCGYYLFVFNKWTLQSVYGINVQYFIKWVKL